MSKHPEQAYRRAMQGDLGEAATAVACLADVIRKQHGFLQDAALAVEHLEKAFSDLEGAAFSTGPAKGGNASAPTPAAALPRT